MNKTDGRKSTPIGQEERPSKKGISVAPTFDLAHEEKPYLGLLKRLEADRHSVERRDKGILRELKDFTHQISSYFGESGCCQLLIGPLTKYGQEYKVVLTFSQYYQPLFIVYGSQTGTAFRSIESKAKLELSVNLHERLLKFVKSRRQWFNDIVSVLELGHSPSVLEPRF